MHAMPADDKTGHLRAEESTAVRRQEDAGIEPRLTIRVVSAH